MISDSGKFSQARVFYKKKKTPCWKKQKPRLGSRGFDGVPTALRATLPSWLSRFKRGESDGSREKTLSELLGCKRPGRNQSLTLNETF